MPPNKGGIFFVFVGNIPFLLANRDCQNRDEYFSAAQIDLQFIEKLYAPCEFAAFFP
jgi:hypothetical protein